MVCTSGTSPVCLVDLVCFVHLVYPVSLVQPNKQDKPNKPIKRDRPDKPNRPHEQDRLADFFSILLSLFDRFFKQRPVGLCIEGRHGLTFRKITRNGEFFGGGRLGGLDHLQ